MSMTPTERSTYAFAIAEFNVIHAICDTAEIPRHALSGGKFTASQRVKILATLMETTRATILKAQQGDRPTH